MLPQFARFLALSAMAMAAALVAQTGSPIADRAASIGLFEQRVAAYVSMRDRRAQEIQCELGPRSSDEVFRRTLRETIRSARRAAHPGDILNPTLAPEIVRIVRDDLTSRERPDRQAIVAEVPQMAIRVNEEYPAGAPLATTPPRLLLRLPQLAPELQYRFVGRALILLDADANLVLDVVPDALPPNQ
jgi:hypothetical protein